MDHLCYFCLVLLCFHGPLFVVALWSPAGKGLTSWPSFVNTYFVREPIIGLIKWLRPKGLKVCSYVEKCAEFKNQTLKKIDWYTKVICATEYPRGMQYLKIALKWGDPCSFIL